LVVRRKTKEPFAEHTKSCQKEEQVLEPKIGRLFFFLVRHGREDGNATGCVYIRNLIFQLKTINVQSNFV
jgi:hypothetical protein